MLLYGETALSGGAALPSGPGYALVAKGSFTAKDAKVPANAALPTGAYLTQVVRKSDGAIMDWGVTDIAPDLSARGTVVSQPR